MWTFVTRGWLLDNAENLWEDQACFDETKCRYTEENGESVDTDGLDYLVRAEWRSSYYEMTHHDKNVMDDNLIFNVQHSKLYVYVCFLRVSFQRSLNIHLLNESTLQL